jgi:hypothetical protein
VNSYHYGDRERVIGIVGDTLIGLAIVAVLIEIGARVAWRRRRVPDVATACAVLGVANAVLLISFVHPLYAPMTADDYAALVSRYIGAHDTARAANLYVSAVESYPQSSALRSLADQSPSLLFGGSSPSARALFWQWLARGNSLRDRDALLMLANDLRRSGGIDQPFAARALAGVLADADTQPDLAEPAALVRAVLARDRHETGEAAIRAGGGQVLNASLRNGDVIIVGFTTHRAASGGSQLIVYFRARGEMSSRRLWVHAYPYPIGGPSFVTPDPILALAEWRPNELMWELFELPPGPYATYAGAWVGSDPGEGALLGLIQ